MPNVTEIEAALSDVRDQRSFIERLLRDTLEWPIDPDAQSIEEIGFRWSAADLRADGLDKRLVDGQILQVQPFRSDQPWGVFILEFKNPEVFRTDRGMAGTLRRVLRGLVRSRRRQANLPFWEQDNLLFVCNHDYQHFRFASFRTDPASPATSRIAAFGWGPDIPRRTACEFNLPPLVYDPDLSAEAWVARWSEAFDVEKVTKRFYADYARVFGELEAALKGPKTDEDRRLTAQTLMNRLMFLRFVERKGWLKMGDRTDYLRALAEAPKEPRSSIYRSRLKPLFFDALGAPSGDSSLRNPDAVGDVPFLGGGLFEETPQDEKLADVPDGPLLKVIGPEGLFYRYNFTVEESTPLDVEVAVDPEMLGKVFEELVTGRHESGSYYTPRPVVSFMCREALKGYLADKAGLTPEVAAAYVDGGDVSGIEQPKAREIIDALDNLKAVDPACGSGAYLLGLLHELLRLYDLLYSDKLKRDSRSLYDLKLQIISHSLYGVDIDPFATNIAMLRLWLSLVVEADDPVPLPNLDFKIETGDSLLGPDPRQTTELFGDALTARADMLIALKEKYLSAQAGERANYRAAIDKEIAEIAFKLRGLRGEGVIDWRIQFAEVFVKNGGFDVVLANPPYVRQELIRDHKPAFKEFYGDLFSGTADLYVFFYLRALQLLAEGGMLVFISSNKWFRAGYGLKLRSHIAKTTSVRAIVDFHDLPVFESAIAYPMIFIAGKRPPQKGHAAVLAEPPTLDPPYPDVLAVMREHGHRLPNGAIGADGVWHLATSAAADALQKMRAAGPTLGEYVQGQIFYGVKTGLNEAWVDGRGRVYTKGQERPAGATKEGVFIIDGRKADALISADPKSREIIKPLIVGRDIDRWHAEHRDRWLIFTRRGIDINKYPAVKEHLSRFEAVLAPKQRGAPASTPGRKPGAYAWYEIQDEVAYHEEFSKAKIVYPVITQQAEFALDRTGAFCNDKGYIIGSGDLYLLAVLNSRPFWLALTAVCSPLQGAFFEMRRASLEGLPIPEATAQERTPIERLAQKCLDAKGVGCEAWEEEINERVAALYGLTLAEIVRA